MRKMFSENQIKSIVNQGIESGDIQVGTKLYRHVISASENNYFEEKKTISFSVKGKMFGIIDIDVSQSKSLKDPWYCQKTIQVIDDVDFFVKNGKKIKEQSFEITTSTYILAVKNIIIGAVTKDYPVSYSKTNEYDRLTNFAYYSGTKPNISSSFSTRISYVNEV